MLTLGCLLAEDNDMEAMASRELLRMAWREWEIYCCLERHGEHLWVLGGEHPDDGGYVYLHCTYCCADSSDLAGQDAVDFITGQVADINIKQGVHDAPVEFEAPVKVDVLVEKHFNPLDMIYPEYDVWIQVQDPVPFAQLAFEGVTWA